MKKLFFAVVLIAGLVTPVASQAAAGFVLVTLGFAWSVYPTDALCMAAGATMTSSVTGFTPNYYCVPITNATVPVPSVGGGYGPF